MVAEIVGRKWQEAMNKAFNADAKMILHRWDVPYHCDTCGKRYKRIKWAWKHIFRYPEHEWQ